MLMVSENNNEVTMKINVSFFFVITKTICVFIFTFWWCAWLFKNYSFLEYNERATGNAGPAVYLCHNRRSALRCLGYDVEFDCNGS